MDWANVSVYLERFRNILPPKAYKEKAVRECFQELFFFDLKRDFFDFKNETLYLKKISPGQKNVFFMNQEKIFKKLRTSLGKKTPKEIRFQ